MASPKVRRKNSINERALSQALAQSWSRATSYDPAHWSRENSAWGQCAVSALIVQDFLGGILLAGKINGVEHYWNRLSDEREFDATSGQFRKIAARERPVIANRAYVLSFPNTRKRYQRLRKTVLAHLKRPQRTNSRISAETVDSTQASSVQALQQ